MKRSSSPSLRALAALALVAGCSVSVQPIRSPAPALQQAKKVAAPKVGAPAVGLQSIDPDKPLPMCPEPAPAPVIEASAAAFVIQNGHSRPITKMAVSDDGGVLATASLDGTVRVWDTRTGLLLRKLGTAGMFVYDVALSGSGDRLAYYAPDGSPDGLKVRVVDLDTGGSPRPIFPFAGPFKLSRDGKQLVAALQSLAVFDTSTGRKLHEVDLKTGKNIALALALDPSGRRAAVAIPGEVVVVDVDRGVATQRINIAAASFGDTPLGVAFAEDAVLVRTAVQTITAYPIETGKPSRVFPDRHADMAVSGDRLWTVDAQTNALRAFALADARPTPVPASDAAMGKLLAVSADRSTLVLSRAGEDGEGAVSVDVRDVGTMRTIRTLEGRTMSLGAIALRPDGAEMASSAPDGRLSRWDLREGRIESSRLDEEETHKAIALAYDQSGDLLVSTTGDYVVRVREAKTGQTLRRWRPQAGFHVRFAAFVPGTDDLLTLRVRSEPVRKDAPKQAAPKPPVPPPAKPPEMRHEAVLERWALGGPRPPAPTMSQTDDIAPPAGKVVGRASFQVSSGALSPDGTSLALLGEGGELALMQVQTGAITWQIAQQKFNRVPGGERDGDVDMFHRWLAFSPDGKTLAMSTRVTETQPNGSKPSMPTLLVFDAATGARKAQHRLETYGPLAWRGDTVAIGGPRPALLEAGKFAVRARIAVPDNTVDIITLHPKRDLFLLGGDAGATSLVTPQGEVAVRLLGTSNGEWMVTTPEGAYRASLDGARSVAWTFASPLEGFSFERFAARFESREVVERRLGGDLSPAPATLSRPPRLTIEGPRRTMGTTERTIKVAARATSSSRVDRVRAFVDGRPVVDELVCAREGQVSLDVPLHAGQNRVSLVAYDAAGYASNTQQLDVVSTSASAERPDLYVVAMGVSRYPKMSEQLQLEFADDDARSIAESLGREVGANKPFARLHLTTLLNDQVTVEGVDRALASLQPMRPDDLAVVFFAGHGARLSTEKMVFLTSRAAFNRASAEAEGIDWSRIQTGLGRVRGRVLLLLDACHSGHMSTEVIAPNEQLARELAAGQRAGVLVFSASRGSQYSYEVPAQGSGYALRGFELAWEGKPPSLRKALPGGHGLFTSAVLEALEGEAPDRDRSGAIEVGEFVDYVTERVRAASNGKQTPWVARREMFGEFMVAPARR